MDVAIIIHVREGADHDTRAVVRRAAELLDLIPEDEYVNIQAARVESVEQIAGLSKRNNGRLGWVTP